MELNTRIGSALELMLAKRPSQLTDDEVRSVVEVKDEMLQLIHQLWQDFPAVWEAELDRRNRKWGLRAMDSSRLERRLDDAKEERAQALAALREHGGTYSSSSSIFQRSAAAVDEVAILEEVLRERHVHAA